MRQTHRDRPTPSSSDHAVDMFRGRTARVAAVAALLLLGAWPGSAAAATREWTGAISIDWNNTSNWNPTGAPLYSDVLRVWAAPYGNLPMTNSAVGIGGGTGQINVKNSGISATFNNLLYVGYNGVGELLIEDGGSVSSADSYISYSPGYSGSSATVAGAGSTWNVSGTHFYVGYYGSGELRVEDGGSLSSRISYIGDDAASTGNVVTVTGANSTWDTDGNPLYVGCNGSASMTIENGGVVSSGYGCIGSTSSSSGNSVTVTGSGSSWDTGTGNLYVGQSGSAELTIENGGVVSSGYSYIGCASSSTGNLVTITGSGSTWDLGLADLVVGLEGSGDLTIADGGSVLSGKGVIGYELDSTGNSVTLTGSSSTWNTNASNFYVGNEGSGTLNIQSGGSVSSGIGYIGYASSSTGNLATVSGTGSTWDLGSADLYVGRSGSGTLTIADGGSVLCAVGYISYLSSGNSVTVTGSGSTWNTNGNSLYAGYQGPGTLAIEAGGSVSSGIGYIGYGSASTGSSVIVTGTGSTWDTGATELYVGYDGSASLAIEQGGSASSGAGYIGYEASSTGNSVTITGTGSTWNLGDGFLYVGSYGSGSLRIEAGGSVTSKHGYIGYEPGSTGNSVTVTGTDGMTPSTWNTGTSAVFVGYQGSGSLSIEDHGSVSCGMGFIGYYFNSTDNSVTVTGSGSTWDLNYGLTVGYTGSGTLLISNGGSVSSMGGCIGHDDGHTDSAVTVTGTNSTWDMITELWVGYDGSGSLTIENGGSVSNRTAFIGAYVTAIGNEVTVTGNGSTWDTDGEALYVGYEGSGSLTIENLGSVSSGPGYIGERSTSIGSVTVTGWATWDCTSLVVGNEGSGTLSIENAGQVTVAGPLSIGADGEIVLDGGTLSVGSLGNLDGTLDFIAGTLRVTDCDITFGYGGPLGSTRTFGAGQTFQVDQQIFVDPDGQLTADGGNVQAGTLRNDGTLSVQHNGRVSTTGGLENTVVLTLAGGTLAGPGTVTNGPSGTLSARGLIDTSLDNYGTWTLSGALQMTGTTNQYGSLDILPAQVLRQDGTLNNYGQITLDGGAITGSGSLVNQPGGTISGGNGIQLLMTNAGLVHATAGSTLLISDLSGDNLGSGELRVEDDARLQVLTSFNNAGLVRLLGADASLSGGSLTNSGTIAGQGRVSNPITNSGQIRADGPDMLILSGNGLANNSTGLIEVMADATLVVTCGLDDNLGSLVLRGGTFENNSRPMTNSGYITGFGMLRTGDLTNDGHVGVGVGDMDVIGPVTNNGTIAVQSGATLTFYGSVDGPGSFPGSGTVVFLADYSPGASPAEVSFDGNVSLEAAARLIVELGGTEPGTQYDAIDVADTLLLGGMLDVRFIDGFVPTAGNTFDILDWSVLDGTFDGVLLPELPGNLGWNTDDLYVCGELKVVSAERVPGDANGDGRVDETDLATLADNWGQPGADWSMGDFDGDGRVGPKDASILAANWGYGTGEATNPTVPEPSTPALLLALLSVLFYPRRRFA